MERYVIVVGPAETAEDAVGAGERVKELNGGSGVRGAGGVHTCADRPVVGIDFKARRIVNDNAQITWRAAFTRVRLDMEPLNVVALLGIIDLARLVVLFAGEGLGEGMCLGRLENPNGLVEDLERDDAPLPADLEEIMLPFDGPKIVL